MQKKWIFKAYKSNKDYESGKHYFEKEFNDHSQLKVYSGQHSKMNKKLYPDYVSHYEKKKVTRKDISILKGTIKSDVAVIDGKIINLKPVPYQSIEQFITHEDCEYCGVEFEKRYTYDKYCSECQHKRTKERYLKLELVEWNGEDYLNLFNDDKYFFDLEEIMEYCDENEIELKDLQLVTTYKTTFSPIDWETIEQDQTHEDWEPSDEFKAKVIIFALVSFGNEKK